MTAEMSLLIIKKAKAIDQNHGNTMLIPDPRPTEKCKCEYFY